MYVFWYIKLWTRLSVLYKIMALFTKLAILMFLIKKSKLHEMYAEYSKTTVIHFDQFWDNCAGFEQNNTLLLKHFRAHGNRSSILFDYVTRITMDLPQFSIAINLERCASKEALDTCMKLTSLKTGRICAMIASTHDFWSPAVQCSSPKYECYPKKGIYKGTDCYYRMSAFNWFPLSTDNYWRVKFRIIAKESKEVLNCVLFSGKLENKKLL